MTGFLSEVIIVVYQTHYTSVGIQSLSYLPAFTAVFPFFGAFSGTAGLHPQWLPDHPSSSQRSACPARLSRPENPAFFATGKYFLFFPGAPNALFERRVITYQQYSVACVDVDVTIDRDFLIETARQRAVVRLQRFVDTEVRQAGAPVVVCDLVEDPKVNEALVRLALFTDSRGQLEKIRNQSVLWRPILDELMSLVTID